MIRYIIGAGVLAGVFYGGYDYGKSTTGAELAAVRAEMARQVLDNEQLSRRYAELAERADTAFSDAARLHSAGAGRVVVQQPADCRGSKVPAVAAPTHQPEPATGESGHRTADDAPGTFTGLTVTPARCEVIANRAVLDAAQVLHLQGWYEALRQAQE